MCPSSTLTQKTPGTHVANTITFTIYQQPPKSLSCGGVWFSRDINPNYICPWPRTVSESLRSEKAKRHGLCWVTHSRMKAEGRSSGFMANDLRQSGFGSERDGGNGAALTFTMNLREGSDGGRVAGAKSWVTGNLDKERGQQGRLIWAHDRDPALS